MGACSWPWGAAMVATCVVARPALAATEAELLARETEREAPLVDNLQKLAPEVAAVYAQAVALVHEGRMAEAEPLLAELHHEAPGSTLVTRRLCLVRGALGKVPEAVALCREAAGDGAARNLSALAYALVGFGTLEHGLPDALRDEARELAAQALVKDPDDVLAHRALCLAARAAGDGKGMRGCTTALERLDTGERAAAMWLERGRVFFEMATRAAEPNAVELDEGAYAAKKAAALRSGWGEPTFLLAEIALARGDHRALEAALGAAERDAPDDARTAELEAIVALAAGDFARARGALDRAEARGLEPARLERLREDVERGEPVGSSWLVWLLAVAVASGAGLTLFGRRRRRGGVA